MLKYVARMCKRADFHARQRERGGEREKGGKKERKEREARLTKKQQRGFRLFHLFFCLSSVLSPLLLRRTEKQTTQRLSSCGECHAREEEGAKEINVVIPRSKSAACECYICLTSLGSGEYYAAEVTAVLWPAPSRSFRHSLSLFRCFPKVSSQSTADIFPIGTRADVFSPSFFFPSDSPRRRHCSTCTSQLEAAAASSAPASALAKGKGREGEGEREKEKGKTFSKAD